MTTNDGHCLNLTGNAMQQTARPSPTFSGKISRLARQALPAPLRFLAVGGIGLATDMSVYMLADWQGFHHLVARAISLAVATLVTWSLNRWLTFDRSGRRKRVEVLRYSLVTGAAQGTSYAIFALLMLTGLSAWPLAAIVAGAAVGAVLSYSGHRLFSFAPAKSGAAAHA